MRVVSPLHVASPQLHSPEVSSTVSTPASADKVHHTHPSMFRRPVMVQGFRSVNVAACAFSNSDTESECSCEVAQINVFKDPNRCLPASRILCRRNSLEEDDDTESTSNVGEGEQEQGDDGHNDDMPSDTVSDSRPSEVSREDGSEQSLKGTEEPPSTQQRQCLEQVVEETNEIAHTRKKAASKPASPRSKPATVGSKMACPGNKPATVGSKAASPGNKPTTVGTKTASPGNKTATVGSKTGNPGNKTATVGNKPATVWSKPASPGNKPATIGSKPATIGSKPATTKSKTTSTRNRRKSSKVCMPRKSHRKVEVVTDDDDDDASEVPVVPFVESPKDTHEVQSSPLKKYKAGDATVAASPHARRKRHWHNKTLSSDEEEDDPKPSSVEEVGGPKEATAKETSPPSPSQQDAEKAMGKLSPVKVSL